MIIKLVSIGHRPPAWLREGFDEYARRLPRELRLELKEIAPARGRNTQVNRQREAERMLAAVPPGARLVCLDERGQAWSTLQLADRLRLWRETQSVVCMLIGGADGLDETCREQAHEVWSLSPLTLPHLLVRVLVAEQVYRAWSHIIGHPYHREG